MLFYLPNIFNGWEVEGVLHYDWLHPEEVDSDEGIPDADDFGHIMHHLVGLPALNRQLHQDEVISLENTKNKDGN